MRGHSAALPRRVRFYHSKIDSISLSSGVGLLQQACELLDYAVEDYENAKKLIETV